MQVFRDEYGQANPAPGAGLPLYLRDFACDSLTADLPNELLLLSAATLTRILCEAEEEEHMRMEKLEERLNYPRHLAPSPRVRFEIKSPQKERALRLDPVLEVNDEEADMTEDSREGPFEAPEEEDNDGHNATEGST